MRKIIFFDIDGTIFSHQKRSISEKVRQSIKKAKEKGYLCFIASGRPYGYIAENVKAIGFDGYVLANGANIKYREENLVTRYLNAKDVQELYMKVQKRDIEYVFQTTELCYLDESFLDILDFYKRFNIDFKNFCFSYQLEEVIEKTIKMEIRTHCIEDYEYALSCCSKFSVEEHREDFVLEVYDSHVSKATGILDVLKLLDISIDKSYCFGDGPNDIEMFQTVGHPFAMGNAIEAIKELAEDICLSVDEDGVAYKLEELFQEKGQ